MSEKTEKKTDFFERLLIPQVKEAQIALQFAKIAKSDYKALKNQLNLEVPDWKTVFSLFRLIEATFWVCTNLAGYPQEYPVE